MENGLEQQVLAKAQKWLDGNYDAETKKQVKYLMDNDMKELVESFYKDLEFGTGGLRGVMGVGTNRMNIYTVGAATQGLSNYLKRNFAGEEIRVVAATSLSMDNHIPVLVFALKDPYNIVRALRGEKIGTIVKEA